MKVAVMMRAMDQDSGFRVIVEGFVEGMLKLDRENTYLLLYRTKKWLGRFSSFDNANELLVWAPHKFIWDQIAVPYIAWKEDTGIIFNPKFSIPLISHCPVVMGLQEPVWWAWPEHYEWFNVKYMRFLLPLYCRKASHLFPNSQFILEENCKYLNLKSDKMTVTYSAPHEYFRVINDSVALEEFRVKYSLPKRFILSVTRVDHPGLEHSTSWHPGKNVETTIRAFIQFRKSISHKLVIAGRNVREYLLHTGWNGTEFEDIHFTGFLPHEELPKLYNLADLFVIPSFYEGCPSTLLEAMACGCPVIASETGACPDLSGGSAILADPYNPSDFAEKILLVLNNEDLRKKLKEKSLQRAAFFKWEKTAKSTLEQLTRIVNGRKNMSN